MRMKHFQAKKSRVAPSQTAEGAELDRLWAAVEEAWGAYQAVSASDWTCGARLDVLRRYHAAADAYLCRLIEQQRSHTVGRGHFPAEKG